VIGISFIILITRFRKDTAVIKDMTSEESVLALAE
jgi:hypothetical protein